MQALLGHRWGPNSDQTLNMATMDAEAALASVSRVGQDSSIRFECPECKQLLASKQKLEGHLVRKHADKYASLGIPCHVCQEVFSETTIDAHVRTHDDAHRVGMRARPGEGLQPCAICGHLSSSKTAKSAHLKTHGVSVYQTASTGTGSGAAPRPPPMPRSYPCSGRCGNPDCVHVYSHPQHRDTHVASVTGVKAHPCAFCEKPFANTSDLGKHRLACPRRPDGGTETFTCTLTTLAGAPCTYVGASKTALKQHVKGAAHVARPKMFTCAHPGCTYAHVHPKKVAQHAVYHAEDRPFRCAEEGCHAAFKTNGDLVKHGSVHAAFDDTPARKRTRTECDPVVGDVEPRDRFMHCWMCHPPLSFAAKLSNGFDMLDHMAVAHPEHHFPVGCPYCPPSTLHQPGARTSQWRHTEGCTMHTTTESRRKYKMCRLCQVHFSVPHLLFRHLNQVHGARFADVCTLKCSVCTATFTAASGLRAHACEPK